MIVALGSLLGCSWLHPQGDRDPIATALQDVDSLYRQRADPEQLQLAMEQLQELKLEAGDDPRLLARLARGYHAQAYGHERSVERATVLYEAGREAAWQCLYQDPAFSGVVGSLGGRIGPAAAARIGADQLDCLLSLVANWTRWLQLRDPGAYGIDLVPLLVLADRGVELAGEDRRGAALHYAALGRALKPLPLGPDLDRAEELLLQATMLDPENLSLRVDLAEHVYLARDDRERAAAELAEAMARDVLATGQRWGLENSRAQERARALLEADEEEPGHP